MFRDSAGYVLDRRLVTVIFKILTRMLYSFRTFRTLVISAVVAALLGSCSGEENEVAVGPTPIARFDLEIEQYIVLDSAERVEFLKRESRRLGAFAVAVGLDTVSNTSVSLMSTWPATTEFAPGVNKIYTDLKAEEAALGRIRAVAKDNGIALPANDFVAVTWGKPQSIGFVDSVMMIALNHYLGPLNEVYNGWPEYMRRLKSRDMIPVDMAEALVATARPFDSTGDETVAKRLIYEGVLAVAKERMVPGASLSAVLGIASERIDDVIKNEAFMWKQLTTGNRLYSADAAIMDDLFRLQAVTASISPDAPGRAVRYVGYRIVKNYLMVRPGTTLNQLLSPEFYNDPVGVLRVAGYNPR